MKIIEKGFFKRNKKIILISLVIFLVFAVASAVVTYIHVGDQAGLMTKTMMNATKNGTVHHGNVELSSVYLFTHNFGANIIIILGGLLFSVISVITTVINALSVASIFGSDFTFACLTVLPHAVFEYAATVLALACAFLITKIEIQIIKKRDLKNTLRESKTELKDILVFIIVMVILLAIAAVIEAHITPMIFDWYFLK